jgi:hypothetical protein
MGRGMHDGVPKYDLMPRWRHIDQDAHESGG